MLEAKDLTVIYPNKVEALKSVNICLEETGLYYLIGPSGSGKSTFLNVFLGLIKNYKGSAILFQHEMKDLEEDELQEIRRKNISISFQNSEMEKELTVYDNLDYILQNTISKKKDRSKRIKRILKELEIYDLRRKTINKISGGEKARVNLARCLVKDSWLYFLDEPLNGLNKKLREKITKIFEQKAKRSLLIVITHQKDEISDKAGIIEILDGKANVIKKSNIESKEQKVLPNYKTKKFKLINKSLKKMAYNRFRTLCTLFTILLTLVTFGIANLLTTGVSKDIENSLLSNVVKNSISVEKKKYKTLADEKENIDDLELEKIELIYQKYISGKGDYYDIEFAQLFPNKNKLSLIIDNKEINIPTLTTNNLKEIKNPIEAELDNLEEINYDEIYLVMNDIQYTKIFGKQKIDTVCENKNINLVLSLENTKWNYDFETRFKIKKIYLGEQIELLHTKEDLLKHLFIDEMELLYNDKLESSNKYPWTIKRKSYLIIKEEYMYAFLSELLEDSRFNNYNPYVLDDKIPLRIGFYTRIYEKINLEEVLNIGRNSGILEKYSLTSEMYQYGDDGIYSGFDRPFYVSFEKSQINKLIDKYDNTDLPILTSLNISIDGKITGGDIYSSTEKYNVMLETIADSSNIDEKVYISSGLAQKIGFNQNLSNKIHYAYLSSTYFENGRYFHKFQTGELEVSKIIEDERNKIYQTAKYWNIFGIIKLNNEKANNISKVILTFDEQDNLQLIKEKMQQNYSNYYFQVCGEKIENSIRPVIDLIRNILYVLSGISFLIASFLLTFTILLLVLEDKNCIKMKYILGISRKNLKREYHTLAILFALIPGIIAFFTIYITQFSLNGILSSIITINDFKAGMISSFLTLILSFVIAISCIPFIDMKIDDILNIKKPL